MHVRLHHGRHPRSECSRLERTRQLTSRQRQRSKVFQCIENNSSSERSTFLSLGRRARMQKEAGRYYNAIRLTFQCFVPFSRAACFKKRNLYFDRYCVLYVFCQCRYCGNAARALQRKQAVSRCIALCAKTERQPQFANRTGEERHAHGAHGNQAKSGAITLSSVRRTCARAPISD